MIPPPAITHVNALYEPSGGPILIPALSSYPLFNDETPTPVLAAQEDFGTLVKRIKPNSSGRRVNFKAASPPILSSSRRRSEPPASPGLVTHYCPAPNPRRHSEPP